MLADVLLKILGEEQEERGAYRPRPSSAGPERCLRALTFHALNIAPRPFPDRTIAVFDDGKFHEELVKDQIRRSVFQLHSEQFPIDCIDIPNVEGPEWTCRDCEKVGRPSKFPYGRIHGHIDGILTDQLRRDRLLEIKSTNHFSYQRWFRSSFPLDYFAQCALYLVGLEKYLPQPDWIDEALLVFKNKNTAALMEMNLFYDREHDALEVREIRRSDGQAYSPGYTMTNVVRGVIEKFSQVEDLRKQKKLPPRPFEIGSEYPCSYCSWGETCWQDYRGEFADQKVGVELGSDLAAMLKHERTLAAQEAQVTKERKEHREKISRALEAAGIRQGSAGAYTVTRSLSSRTAIDRDLIPESVLAICGKEELHEKLDIREKKEKGAKR